MTRLPVILPQLEGEFQDPIPKIVGREIPASGKAVPCAGTSATWIAVDLGVAVGVGSPGGLVGVEVGLGVAVAPGVPVGVGVGVEVGGSYPNVKAREVQATGTS